MNPAENAKSLADQTADLIIKRIIEKGLEKGSKLDNEKILCESLNVGRSTLREAVRTLVSRNILTVRHGSGIYVSEKLGVPDDPLGFTFVKDKRKLVFDLIEFRRIVEPPISAMAAMYGPDEEISKLKELSENVDSLILAGKPHTEADAAFHSHIGAMSRNSVMPKIEPIIFNAVSLFIQVTGSILKSETIVDHKNLVDAIVSHDPIRASDAMLLHIIHNREVIENMIKDLDQKDK